MAALGGCDARGNWRRLVAPAWPNCGRPRASVRVDADRRTPRHTGSCRTHGIAPDNEHSTTPTRRILTVRGRPLSYESKDRSGSGADPVQRPGVVAGLLVSPINFHLTQRGIIRAMATSSVVSSGPSLDDRQDPILACIKANQFALILGVIAAIVFGVVGLLLTGIVHTEHSPNPAVGWSMVVFSALILVATLRQLAWPVPIAEVTARGLRLRIAGPMSRRGLFFVPWSHVRAVLLTQTSTGSLRGGGRQDALGFQIVQDDLIRLPSVKWNSALAVPEAPACDVAFAASMVSGDIAEWVRRIEDCRVQATGKRGA